MLFGKIVYVSKGNEGAIYFALDCLAPPEGLR